MGITIFVWFSAAFGVLYGLLCHWDEPGHAHRSVLVFLRMWLVLALIHATLFLAIRMFIFMCLSSASDEFLTKLFRIQSFVGIEATFGVAGMYVVFFSVLEDADISGELMTYAGFVFLGEVAFLFLAMSYFNFALMDSQRSDESVEIFDANLLDCRRCGSASAAARNMCSICWSEYKQGEEIRTLPCGHEFHARACIDQWINQGRTTCPLCRNDFRGARTPLLSTWASV